MLEVYNKIIEINKSYNQVKKAGNISGVSESTKELGNQYTKALKKELSEENKSILEELSKFYQSKIPVNYQIKVSLSDFRFQELMDLHERVHFAFNLNCLKMYREQIILYIDKENLEDIKNALSSILVSRTEVNILEEKDYKNKIIDRNERGYRRKFFNRFLPNLMRNEETILIKWFEKATVFENKLKEEKPKFKGKELLDHLYHGQTVLARRGMYVSNKTSPEWSDWEEQELHIQLDIHGNIGVLALKNVEWAEYCYRTYGEPNEYHETGVFIVEEYYLEIKLIEEE